MIYRATTHSDLLVRAKKLGVAVEVVHNASIMNAVGACGLQLYRFGEAISIPFFTETWRPASFYDKIKANHTIGLHTLCLLGNVFAAQWTQIYCGVILSNISVPSPQFCSSTSYSGTLHACQSMNELKLPRQGSFTAG